MLSFARNIVRRVRTRGWWNAIGYSLYRLDDEFRLRRLGIREAMRTAMLNVRREHLDLPDPDGYTHDPTESYHVFRALMNRFVRPTAEDVFLDYGSGTGRALLMAATYPFRKVTGVEYSESLSRIAARVFADVHARLPCPNYELFTMNARDYVVPREVTVIYFYNPFGGETLAAVCGNIHESFCRSPRKLRIVVFRPEQFDKAVAGFDWLVCRHEAVFPIIDPHCYRFYESVLPDSFEGHDRWKEDLVTNS